MFHGYGWDAGSGWLMLLWMLIFWGAILAFGASLLRWILSANQTGQSYPSAHNNRTSAKDIAQQRYARGEISRDEYRQIIQDLSDSGQANNRL
jgi:putative membrane protein